MFLHKEKRAILLSNMKTGSSTMRGVMASLDSGFRTNPNFINNAFLWQLPQIFPDFDVDNELIHYHVACFYRDPIDRFLSGMAYAFRKHPELDSTMRVKQYLEEVGYWGYQYRWLGTLYDYDSWDSNPWHPVPIQYYNFHDFDNELIRLASNLGFDLKKHQIPIINSSEGNRLYYEDLTQEEIEILKELYAPDYKFLASKGLAVPTQGLM